MNTSPEAILNQISDHRFFFRITLATIAGIVVAGTLTLFMHVLIEFSQHELDESTKANILDFVRVKREESSQRKSSKPNRPETKQAPPAPPTPQTEQQSMSDSSLAVAIPSASQSINVELGGIDISTGDGEYLPIVKVAPAYPIKAAAEGVEGQCTVEYTVSETGATKDIKIVPGLCPRIFIRASVDAAERFKYKPRVMNGEAIEVPNVKNRFDFTLEDREDQ
ncbi:MAG: protein TonB [Paraglaciecola sp.]|jgi:protein TonB